jgi:hypothetical protein
MNDQKLTALLLCPLQCSIVGGGVGCIPSAAMRHIEPEVLETV